MSSYAQTIKTILQSPFYIPSDLINLIFEFIGINEFSRLLFWKFLEKHKEKSSALYTLLYYSYHGDCTYFRPFFRIKTTCIENAMLYWLHTQKYKNWLDENDEKYKNWLDENDEKYKNINYYTVAIKNGLLNKHINMYFLKSHEFTLEEINRCLYYLCAHSYMPGDFVWMIKYENNIRDIIRI